LGSVVVYFVITALLLAVAFYVELHSERPFAGQRRTPALGLIALGFIFCFMALWTLDFARFHGEVLFITDESIATRWPFKKRLLNLGEIEKLRWTRLKQAARVQLMSRDEKVWVELSAFTAPDRLRIIRLLRKLVPEVRQEDWPLFCHRVALPLRDGISSRERLWRETGNPPDSAFVMITRRRYDRLLAFALPLALIVAGVGCWCGYPVFLACPVVVAAHWLAMRLRIPRQGRRELRFMKDRSARPLGLAMIVLFACLFLGIVVPRLLNFSKNTAEWVLLASVSPATLWMLYSAHRIDRRR